MFWRKAITLFKTKLLRSCCFCVCLALFQTSCGSQMTPQEEARVKEELVRGLGRSCAPESPEVYCGRALTCIAQYYGEIATCQPAECYLNRECDKGYVCKDKICIKSKPCIQEEEQE
jgi:hypothetical protein